MRRLLWPALALALILSATGCVRGAYYYPAYAYPEYYYYPGGYYSPYYGYYGYAPAPVVIVDEPHRAAPPGPPPQGRTPAPVKTPAAAAPAPGATAPTLGGGAPGGPPPHP